MHGIFEHGQAYVALSRCTSPDTLQVVTFADSCVKAAYLCVEFYQDIRKSYTEDVGIYVPQEGQKEDKEKGWPFPTLSKRLHDELTRSKKREDAAEAASDHPSSWK